MGLAANNDLKTPLTDSLLTVIIRSNEWWLIYRELWQDVQSKHHILGSAKTKTPSLKNYACRLKGHDEVRLVEEGEGKRNACIWWLRGQQKIWRHVGKYLSYSCWSWTSLRRITHQILSSIFKLDTGFIRHLIAAKEEECNMSSFLSQSKEAFQAEFIWKPNSKVIKQTVCSTSVSLNADMDGWKI